MILFTAAIAARHRLTARYRIIAGSVLAESQKEAESKALDACYKKFPPGQFSDHMANVQLVPQEMIKVVAQQTVLAP